MEVLHVLIVDDQRRARQSLKALLAPGFQPVEIHEAASGTEAVNSVIKWLSDIVLMDVRMPELDGIEATRLIKRQLPHLKVLMLSIYDEYKDAALAAGADAFISKSEPPGRLLEAIVMMVRKE